MGQNLSIRNLPQELEDAILKEAKKHHTTKTDVVLKALNAFFQLTPKRPIVKRDVRSFFGKMNQKSYEEFQGITADFSTIDAELWK